MKLIQSLNKLGENIGNFIPDWLIGLATRAAVFMIFWPAVQTKITGGHFLGQSFAFWNLTDTTFLLFEEEYAIPLLPNTLAAYLGTFGEFFFSISIILGLFTRLGAAGLLATTAVIQIFVYPELWITHLIWAAMLIYLLKKGGGAISLDAAVTRS